MRRLVGLLAAGVFVFCCQAAQANTLVTSGPWRVATNWSAGHKPTVEEEAVIPPGLTVTVDKTATSGPLRDEGHVVGSQTLNVFGAVTLAPGSFDLVGTLDLKGLGTIRAEDTIYYLRIDGNDTLAAPLHAHILDWYQASTLVTNGWPVTADQESLAYGNTLLGTSTLTTGLWLPLPPEYGKTMAAQEASLVMTSAPPVASRFDGDNFTYGNVTFLGAGVSRGSYTVLGALTIDGPTTMETGRVVQAGSLVTDGTVEAPEHLSVAGAGTAVIECGCAVPAGLVLEGVEVR